MRQPDPNREYADASFFELALGDILDTVANGRDVPLSRDGEVVGVVVPPEVAEAGRRALSQ